MKLALSIVLAAIKLALLVHPPPVQDSPELVCGASTHVVARHPLTALCTNNGYLQNMHKLHRHVTPR